MKKLIIEIIIIVVVSTVIALFYNYIRPDGIPFIPQGKVIVSDSLLFGDIFNRDTVSQEDIKQELIEEVLITTTMDTLQKPQETVIEKNAKVTESKIDEIDVATILRNVRKTSDGNYSGVSFEQMKKIVSLHSDNFIIIDSRREADFLRGHIPNAINIFSYDDERVVIEKVLTLPRDKTIIIYCDGGSCDLSHHIAALLENFGYERFYLYEGGWNEWSKNQ